MSFHLPSIGAGLPVLAVADELTRAVVGGAVVVQAPPGTGKTTLVPPLLANALPAGAGRVVVTQPRRIAARAAARRLAHLSQTRLGEEVGFSVRGESRRSQATRVEFVTTGVLLRRLLTDPGLDGIGAVVLDEVHERTLDGDLVFAMVTELRELRPELAVVVMSATLDASRWATLLGREESAPIVAVEADLHPLDVRWEPAPPGVQRLDARGVTFAFMDHLAATTARALDEVAEGAALVFVPGAREADQVAQRLRDKGIEADALSGSLDSRRQDEVLTERPGKRAIVATAIAESSLTVPGVRIVVDAGLAREPRHDSARGMGGLVTVSEARSSAQQRAGRAARLGPGIAIRCFPQSDWPRLRDFPTPEMATADLTQAVLDLACWGAPRGEGLALPDAPPLTAVESAEATLRELGALDEQGRATQRGRLLARIPADPRLGRALLDAAPVLGNRTAAELVALLSLDEKAPGGDLEVLLADLRGQRSPASARWRQETNRLEEVLGSMGCGSAKRSPETDRALGLVVALAHPGRIARRRTGEDSVAFLMASGTGVALDRQSRLKGHQWLAVADMARSHTQDGTGATIRSAVPITRELAEQAAEHLLVEQTLSSWQTGKVTARRVVRLGAIELTSTPVAPTPEQGREAVLETLSRDGLGLDAAGLLTWPVSAQELRKRLALLHHELGEPWPDMAEESLLARTDEWLAPELDALARGAKGSGLELTQALRRLLPWPEAARLDKLVPERLEVPTGSRIALDYPDDPSGRVVLAVKLQECFGLLQTPRIVDGRVPVQLHLLSPARRPLAITEDLASFWTNAYPGVRAENRGRYPKHPWPEDPLTASPRRGTKKSGV